MAGVSDQLAQSVVILVASAVARWSTRKKAAAQGIRSSLSVPSAAATFSAAAAGAVVVPTRGKSLSEQVSAGLWRT